MDTELGLDDFKLSVELLGHSSDVRSVAAAPNCTIISGSRDKTAKVWKCENRLYFESLTLRNHTKFVTCVTYLEGEGGGWIVTGGNDQIICVYDQGAQEPFVVLKGHTDTVCALAKGFESSTLISGSWDKTARVWRIDKSGGSSSLLTLQGHEAAVWAVNSFSNGKYVTGSADKNIYYWNDKGVKVRVLKGHQDCVRGLIALSDGSLISCANDAVIKVWNDDGDCIKELHGHGNYIYTIAINSFFGSDILVSGGEDSSIRLWNIKTGPLGNNLLLPAQSVWSVTCLPNGDIVTGTSDGIVRIFTKDPSRVADTAVLNSFNTAVQTWVAESSKELGGVKHTELPGPESLLKPGTDGQTKIVRHPDGKILCYQYEKGQWNCVGDVLGASGGSQNTSGKKLFEGKEYDYVFSVDISDDTPALQLPYNRGEDPWHVAQAFIHKNTLPQVYLDQVANFIIKNSDSYVTRPSTSVYEDPFTGGSRYVPGSNPSNFNASGNVDPFTGATSYSTNKPPSGIGLHFPFSYYMTFDTCDVTKVLEKLKEFNSKSGDNNQRLSEDVLDAAITLANKNADLDRLAVEALQNLLRWPREILFPVLDVARLSVRQEQICLLLANDEFLSIIIQNISNSPANQLMAIRCIVNMMQHSHGRKLILPQLTTIFDLVAKIKQGSANLQIAIATLYLNTSVSQFELATADICQITTEGLLDFLDWVLDLEAIFRCVQALGNLTCTPNSMVTTAQILSNDRVLGRLREFASNNSSDFNKITECATSLLAAL